MFASNGPAETHSATAARRHVSFPADDAIRGWQDAVLALRSQLEHADRARQIELLAAVLATFRQVNDAGEPDPGAAEFGWELSRDGFSDESLLYAVTWHGAPLGEMILSFQSLSEAVDSPGWVFAPGPPLALPGQTLLFVGDEPDATDLLSWLRSLVDPVNIEHARRDIANYCLDRLRLASGGNAEAWLMHLEATDTSVLHYRSPRATDEEPEF